MSGGYDLLWLGGMTPPDPVTTTLAPEMNPSGAFL
jgi:hypothetical protein